MKRNPLRTRIKETILTAKSRLFSSWSRRIPFASRGSFSACNTKADDRPSVANVFSKYVNSVYNPRSLLNLVACDCDNILENLDITTVDVISAFNSVDNKTSSGPNGIPSFFLKKCLSSLVKPVTLLMRRSIASGNLPSVWKHAFVIPIFKAGDKHNVSNYRPISILSSLAKLVNAVMAQMLSDFLLPLIASQQHGFVNSLSTGTNLLVFNSFASNMYENHVQVDAVWIDFSQAFDSVNHAKLLSKLWNLGIRGTLYQWIVSYLSDRSLAVRVLNWVSNSQNVNSGVPQGSHLGPLLFIAFINDLPSIIQNSQILLYADYVKLYRDIRSPLDASLLQLDVDRLCSWATENGCLGIRKFKRPTVARE